MTMISNFNLPQAPTRIYTPPNVASSAGNDTGGKATIAPSQEPGTAEFNKLQGRDPDLLAVDESIKLENGETYKVKDGDTLSSIAQQKGTTLEKLMETNGFDVELLGQDGTGQYFSMEAAQQLSDQADLAPVDEQEEEKDD
jgi:LysM repeat protein